MTEPNRNDETNWDDEDDKKLWEMNLHMDDLLNDRANFTLVGESMLFTAFAALLVVDRFFIMPVIIGIAGIILCILWMFMAWVQVEYNLKPVRNKISDRKKKGHFFEWYYGVASKRRFRNTDILRLWTPLLIISAWSLMLVLYILHFIPEAL